MLKGFLKNKIARNASWMILCRIIQAVLSVVIAMLTARYLGPSNYGIINYGASLCAFFAPVMYLGFNSTLVQELVEDPQNEDKIMGTTITMSIASAVMCMIGIAAFVSIANPGDTETLIVCVLYSTLLIFQAVDLLQYWFLSKYLSKVPSVAMLFSYAVAAVYKIYLLASGKNIVWFAISNSIEYLLIACILLVMYKKKGGSHFRVSWQMGKRMFGKSKYYILSSMMVTIFAQAGKILINILMDEAATGYYSAAFTIITMSSFVFTAIVDSFRPEVLKHKNPEAIGQNMTRLFSIVFYLALAQCILITAMAKPIIYIVYGEAYFPAVNALRIGVWYTIISYMSYARGVWILAMGRQKYLWILNLSGAAANILLNLLLIPQLGISGAAVASVATEFFANIVVCQFIKPMRESNKLMIKATDPRILLSYFR